MTTEPTRQPEAGRWATTVWPTDLPGPHELRALSPALAAYAIAVYTRPGDTVCDPDCANTAVIAEALGAGRHALGIATDPPIWEAARAEVSAAKVRGATGDGMILDAVPGGWSGSGLGPVDLVLTAIRPPRPDSDPDLVGDRLRERLAAYRVLVRSGAHLVALTEPQIVGGSDLASQLAAAGPHAGWRPVQRAVALRAVLSRRVLATPRPPDRVLPAHQDVIVFRADIHGPRHPGPGHPGPQRPFAPAAALKPPAAPAERHAAA